MELLQYLLHFHFGIDCFRHHLSVLHQVLLRVLWLMGPFCHLSIATLVLVTTLPTPFLYT